MDTCNETGTTMVAVVGRARTSWPVTVAGDTATAGGVAVAGRALSVVVVGDAG